jgi:hypothetical protein
MSEDLKVLSREGHREDEECYGIIRIPEGGYELK